MKMFRRGQAALEFLTTYGWAFMVILVMIGALAYFGILSPTRLVPDSCSTTAGFTCTDFKIAKTPAGSDEHINMIFVNNGPDTITMDVTVANVDLIIDGQDRVTSTQSDCTMAPATGIVAPGASITFHCGLGSASLVSTVGQKVKVDFSIPYVITGGTFTHSLTGTLTAAVQAS